MASSSSSSGAFDTIIPSASTFGASSSGTKHPPFHVFINHCGQDVKHTLASKIYESLDATGLKVFLDKSELKYGDLLPKALEEAMASATICIAIFSEHYVESPWCLAELEYMVKTRKTIIPIFYKVDPSVLRWTVAGAEKTYIEAFRRHQEKNRYAPEALQRWKEALQQVSVCIGGIINSIDDEEKVVKYLVNRVKELKNTVPLDVPKHPVALDEVVQDFDDTISLQSAGSVKLIGIWGMGGSGKTTLAKEIFNRRCSHMHWSSFLSDVRDAAGKGLLLEKQKTLLKNLDVKADECPDNIHEGKQILKNRLSRSASVLIVLDDVDHIDQLDALLPSKESFENNIGDQSLIIVTTRDKNVLQQWGISESAIYPMKPLEAIHAKQLFCWHAFKQIIPRQGFEDLVEKFLNACGGLPLSLKVLGGQLCGEPDREYWLQTLNNCSQRLHADIANRLKVSYDALKKEEQQMFLDAACFFIGERSSAAIAAWDAEFQGLIGWKTLFNECLVEEDEDGLIRMHDHLRDLGRVIANGQSPYRLWSPHQIIEITPQQEPMRVRGVTNAVGQNCYQRNGELIINTNQGERRLAPSMLELKIFVGNGEFFSREFSELSKELIWLQCTNFEHKNLPPWLPLKNLRILTLSDSRSLEHLWAADADAVLQLRELVIRRCKCFAGFPSSIGRLEKLQKILINDDDYTGCDALIDLPQEFCYLKSLEHLELRRCSNLSSLPSNFGKLTKLRHLNLTDCTKLEALPDSFKKLTLLEYLSLKGCREVAIKSESNVLENMTKLRYLNLQGCEILKELRLPESVSLRDLHLRSTGLTELPANIFHLTNVTKLEIGSEFLITLPTSTGSLSPLTTLTIEGCNKLKSLPDSLEHLSFLRDLTIQYTGVKCLPKSLIHLQRLTIISTPISELSFRSWGMLKRVSLSNTKVSKISIGGDSCPALETLLLSGNNDLRELETLPEKLKTLDVRYCAALKDIRGIRGLNELKSLEIYGCEMLDEIPCFAELVSLEKFRLEGTSKVEKIEGLEKLRSLRELSIENIDELPSFAEYTSLKKLVLSNCNKLEEIENLGYSKSLEELQLSHCPELKALPSLQGITSLKNLRLEGSSKVEKIEGLEKLRSLRELTIENIDELPSFAEYTSLKKLVLRNSNKLEEKLEEIENLGYLKSLEELEISHCPELKALPGLENMRSLKKLTISDCLELESLPNLSEITSLEEFQLENCYKLEKIEGLERLRRLNKLKVHTRWNAPGIVSLEHSEILESLDVVANDISAVEPFVSNLQTWPSEVMICSRAVCDVGLLKNFFQNMPNVSVLDYAVVEADGNRLKLSPPKSSPIADAILKCFIIDSDHPDLRLYIGFETYPFYYLTELGEGKWVWMGVFTQRRRSEYHFYISAHDSKGEDVKVRVEAAWSVTGEEGSIGEAFRQHFQRQLPDNSIQRSEMSYDELDEEKRSEMGLYDELDEEARVEMSYDELDEKEKQMFLDTACFFIAEEKSLAIAVWDGSEWSGLKGWESLVSKDLVYLDGKYRRIGMHDHVRDFARKIADQQSPPYRLWSPRQFNHIQAEQINIEIRGMVNVTGASFSSSHGKILINTNDGRLNLTQTSLGLKFLVGSGEFLTEEVGELSRELLWLRWDDFNLTNLPPWLSLQNLRVLQLDGALNLQELWKDDAQIPLELRQLIITGTWSASFRRFPNTISKLRYLGKIALLGRICEEFSIKELPEEFCDLQSLEHLELRHCNLLSTLPKNIGKLRQLRYLDLRSCEMLRKLPHSFKELTNLEYLNLSNCENLTPMPDILENMANLKNLCFTGCPELQELPNQITKQKYLKVLHLKKTMLMCLPSNIDQLSELQTLVIGSPHLTELPASLGNLSSLTSLKITGCIQLEILPESVGYLKHLEYLYIKSSGVRCLPEGFWQFPSLQYLKIIDCPISELDFGSESSSRGKQKGSSSLGKLKAIYIEATDVERLSISHNCCPNLEILQLELNDRLTALDIRSLSVKEVKLYQCTRLRKVESPVHTETFEVFGCPEFRPNSITAAMRTISLKNKQQKKDLRFKF